MLYTYKIYNTNVEYLVALNDGMLTLYSGGGSIYCPDEIIYLEEAAENAANGMHATDYSRKYGYINNLTEGVTRYFDVHPAVLIDKEDAAILERAKETLPKVEYTAYENFINEVFLRANGSMSDSKYVFSEGYVASGRKFDKLVIGGSVNSFVEKKTGLVWKPAGYKAPERNYPRGNIYDLDNLGIGASGYTVGDCYAIPSLKEKILIQRKWGYTYPSC